MQNEMNKVQSFLPCTPALSPAPSGPLQSRSGSVSIVNYSMSSRLSLDPLATKPTVLSPIFTNSITEEIASGSDARVELALQLKRATAAAHHNVRRPTLVTFVVLSGFPSSPRRVL